jgi:hypothetical protein
MMSHRVHQKLAETDEDDSQVISRPIGLIYQAKQIILFFMFKQGEHWKE